MTLNEVLAVIPARKGSKGIKGKNIRKVFGKKLFLYTLEAAMKSKSISKIVVSTDCEEIISDSRALGIDVKNKRPSNLCTSEALTVDDLNYEINQLAKNNEYFKYILLLQPTCPLRTYRDIDESFSLIKEKDCDSLISVVDVDGQHPLRMKSIRNNYLYNYIDTGFEDMRPRQKLPKVYIRNGSIYFAKMDFFKKRNGFGSDKCLAFKMPEERSVNIDNEKDMLIAEFFLKKLDNN